MRYLKKRLDDESKDWMRVNLSVRDKKLSAEPVCDFCGDPHPIFVYGSHRMATGETQQCWRWCACQICSDAIDKEDWDTLQARALRRLNEMMPSVMKGSPLILSAIRYALQEFRSYVVLTISFVK